MPDKKFKLSYRSVGPVAKVLTALGGAVVFLGLALLTRGRLPWACWTVVAVGFAIMSIFPPLLRRKYWVCPHCGADLDQESEDGAEPEYCGSCSGCLRRH